MVFALTGSTCKTPFFLIAWLLWGNPWEQAATAHRSVHLSQCSWNCFPMTACLCHSTLMLSCCNYQQLRAEGSNAILIEVSNYLYEKKKEKKDLGSELFSRAMRTNWKLPEIQLSHYLLIINQFIMASYHIQSKSLTQKNLSFPWTKNRKNVINGQERGMVLKVAHRISSMKEDWTNGRIESQIPS